MEEELETLFLCVSEFIDESDFGAELQWVLIVRLLAELCQHGNESDVKEITDALAKSLIEVCFKKEE